MIMWLIETSTLELKFVTEAETCSYAILSHTWDDGEELTFDQFRNIRQTQLDDLRQRRGFTKIAKTCELASKYGLSYAWVDTCCIDKSSSAELSEAINSMFKYYQNAAFCLAFISDLPSCPNVPDAYTAFGCDFPRCRWLTRGWTLQELIAPSQLFFYDSSWKYRGSKSDWKTLLFETTGVDEAILDSPNGLRSVPIARRMSWASKRHTTRVEDMAYSLLGIFDVNIPLIYGEGHKAFRRLQEEIVKESCDLSLFAWRQLDSAQRYRGILAASVAEFSHCREIKFRVKGVIIPTELTLTNRGLRTETALVSSPAAGDYMLWNLSCSYRDDWPAHRSRGWLGVYLAKTQNGFVRAMPNKLFEARDEDRERCPLRSIYVLKTVDALESLDVSNRFERGIKVFWPETIDLKAALPESLWVENNDAFLHQGRGINAYLRCEAHLPDGTAQPIIVSCSTMDPPVCAIWSPDHLIWDDIEFFLNNSNERADFVAVDYLRRHFIGRGNEFFSLKAEETLKNQGTGASILVSIELKEEAIGERSYFALRITTQTPQDAGNMGL